MTQLIKDPLPIEKEVENDFFTAQFVRQKNGDLYAHINYKKWSKEAKKVTKELMDSFDEPLYAFIHNTQHFKYLSSMGWEPTGELIECPFPGKEGQLFGGVVYHKDGFHKYYLKTYEEVGKLALPFDYIDGYGNIEKIEKYLATQEQAAWKTKHHFSEGVYTRETFVPKGTILTGYRHKFTSVSVLASGIISVTVVDKQGHAEDKGLLTAPAVFTTAADIKKIGFAHEDTVFVNSFSLSGLDSKYHSEGYIDMIEDYLFEKEETCLE